MQFHEKTLELNITHELLSLADSWAWFLFNPVRKYWEPGFRLPFLKYPRSTAAGFHITTEGKDDSTGEAGGGFDVRIKSGTNGNLLFIQYKKGELVEISPNPKSTFHNPPKEHFKFKINSTKTNQHFVLRNLADNIGKEKGNAVVYAFPLIKNMADLENNAGKLLRKTKFVSIKDIDIQAEVNKVKLKKRKEHNFRIGKDDMDRCEVNYYYYYFIGGDRTPEIIADIIAIKFQEALSFWVNYHKDNVIDGKLLSDFFEDSLIKYIEFLLHYFEVAPSKIDILYINRYLMYFQEEGWKDYKSVERDIKIVNAVFGAISSFEKFITVIRETPEKINEIEVPKYEPQFLISVDKNSELKINFEEGVSRAIIEDINYLIV